MYSTTGSKYPYFHFQVSEEPILIVTEYMALGNLQHYLRKGAGRKSTQADHYDMAAQV